MISLSKALKIKNRIAGELAKLHIQAATFNSVRIDLLEGKTLDLNKVWEDLNSLKHNLIDIKSKIAVATGPISPKLVRMAELKADLAFLASVVVKEGNEDFQIGYGSNATFKTVSWKAYISLAGRDKMVKEFTTQIETLQDEVDEFNAITKIDY
jgi:hypothetical protein